LQSGVNVVLPKADHPDEDPNIIKESAVVVALPDAGFYYIGRDMITDKEKLIVRIKRDMDALKPNDPHVVYIKAGLNVPYGEVVKLVDMIREAGFDQLGLVADKKKAEKGK